MMRLLYYKRITFLVPLAFVRRLRPVARNEPELDPHPRLSLGNSSKYLIKPMIFLSQRRRPFFLLFLLLFQCFCFTSPTVHIREAKIYGHTENDCLSPKEDTPFRRHSPQPCDAVSPCFNLGPQPFGWVCCHDYSRYVCMIFNSYCQKGRKRNDESTVVKGRWMVQQTLY